MTYPSLLTETWSPRGLPEPPRLIEHSCLFMADFVEEVGQPFEMDQAGNCRAQFGIR